MGSADSLFVAVLNADRCSFENSVVAAENCEASEKGRAGAFAGSYMNYGGKNVINDCDFEGRVIVGGSADKTETNYVGNLDGNPNSPGMKVTNCNITFK